MEWVGDTASRSPSPPPHRSQFSRQTSESSITEASVRCDVQRLHVGPSLGEQNATDTIGTGSVGDLAGPNEAADSHGNSSAASTSYDSLRSSAQGTELDELDSVEVQRLAASIAEQAIRGRGYTCKF